MTPSQKAARVWQHGRILTLAAATLALAACAEPDDSIGSRLQQPPAGTPKMAPIDAGDIALAGEQVAHSIMNLPVVAGASVPPLVRFNGVTSIVDQPIDTEPYTNLLRDRLLLITREKLRFYEHTLPPLITKHHNDAPPLGNTTDPDFEILAELRGHADKDYLKVQIEFVDAHSHDVLFSGLYQIRREADFDPSGSAPQGQPQPMPPQAPSEPSPSQMAPPTTSSGVL